MSTERPMSEEITLELAGESKIQHASFDAEDAARKESRAEDEPLKHLSPEQRQSLFSSSGEDLLLITFQVFNKHREHILSRANSGADLVGDVLLANRLAARKESGAGVHESDILFMYFESVCDIWQQLQEARGGSARLTVERILTAETAYLVSEYAVGSVSTPTSLENSWKTLSGINPRSVGHDSSSRYVTESDLNTIYTVTKQLRNVMFREGIFSVIDEGIAPPYCIGPQYRMGTVLPRMSECGA